MPQRLTDTHYTKTGLLGRGWTEPLIERLFASPDKATVNMRHKSGPKVQWYAQERVHRAEADPVFAAAQSGREARRAAARKGADTKRAALLREVAAFVVTVPTLEAEVLTARAIAHYNDRPRRRSRDEDYADPASPGPFLDRIRVNYVRHQLTEYDQAVRRLRRRVGKGEAYCALKRKVLAAIAAAYPDLCDECRRQQGRVAVIG